MEKHTSKITIKKLCIAYFKVTFTQKINRLPRSYFWFFQIFLIIEAPIIASCFSAGMDLKASGDSSLATLDFIVGTIVALLFFMSRLEMDVARLHDSDHSAWNLLWFGLPWIGGIIAWVILGLYGSNEEENTYGKPFDYDNLVSLPPSEETYEESPSSNEKANADTHVRDSLKQLNDVSSEKVIPDLQEYWCLISFVYSKVKQTNIFKLWRKEQFDCQFGKCAICNKPMEREYNQVDHIKPRYNQGTNYSNNLALVHKKCNENKGAKTGYAQPSWFKNNKYSEELDKKVYELTEEIRKEYPTKFPDELFRRP